MPSSYADMLTNNVLLIWDRIGDYHRARWSALAEKIGNENVFAADLGAKDNLYRWENTSAINNQYILLSGKPLSEKDTWNRFRRFAETLLKNRIQVVGIPGYGRIEYLLFILFTRLTGRRVVLFAESWYGHNCLFNLVKGVFLRIFCHAFLVSGELAFQHFTQRLYIPVKRIRMGYSVVENAHFAEEKEKFVAKNELPILLCIARFSPEKNLVQLIQIFVQSELSRTHQLKIVGGGPLFSQLEMLIMNHSNVSLLEWTSYQKLPDLYHQADGFVLPSIFEPWGLVVNEAMAAGLPVIASQQCGCVPDLVSAENGFVFDATQPEQMLSVFNKFARLDRKELQRMGERSRLKIKNYTPERWAENFTDLIE